MQDRARIVIVGAGIVGCSTAYHLTQLGWTDVVVARPGPPLRDRRLDVARARPRVPGQPVAHRVSKLAQDTVDIYERPDADEHGPVWQGTGQPRGRDDARAARGGPAARGATGCVGPRRAASSTPTRRSRSCRSSTRDRILGCAVRQARRHRASAAACGRACGDGRRSAARTFYGNTAVTGHPDRGRPDPRRRDRGRHDPRRPRPDRGRHLGPDRRADGRDHDAADAVPPSLRGDRAAARTCRRRRPAARSSSTRSCATRTRSMYYKQWGDRVRHRVVPPRSRCPSRPSTCPRENGHSVAHLADFPEELSRSRCECTRRSCPPSGGQPSAAPAERRLLVHARRELDDGRVARVEGLWLAEAIWVTHGAGAGKLMAEWIVDGVPSYDVREVDLRRFHHHVYEPRVHPAARDPAVPRGLRRHPPDRPVHRAAQPAPEPVPRRASRSWARSSSRAPAGSGRAGTRRTRALLDGRTGRRGRVGGAQLVADQRRRAHGDPRGRRR